nr:MAG TPA: hypothetical protein [Caudoviricetes sp.]
MIYAIVLLLSNYDIIIGFLSGYCHQLFSTELFSSANFFFILFWF